ncbi:unnamed protein product [Symbiodinium sp. CCMP2592]|nr:unnamed protein product [Symbiodinium sp. CCMP2592]
MEPEAADLPVANERSSADPSPFFVEGTDEESDGATENQAAVGIPLSDAYERAAEHIANFRATREGIVRATPCYEVLRGFGRIFRFRSSEYYRKSFSADKIQEFWSHSWHGSTTRKISTMMVQKNGFAAICLGSLASLLLAGLFVAGYLPGYERAPFLKLGRTSYLFSVWGVLGGTLTAVMTLFCWQRRTLVFVDVICINQADPSLKAEALLSMGAFLQSSESLHVFWDETFVQRLWCIFEVGAYLGSCKLSNSGRAKRLVIRPTMLGTSSTTAFLGSFLLALSFLASPFDDLLLGWVIFSMLCIVCCHFAVRSLRSYFAAVESMLIQLRKFRVQDAQCHCCTVGHTEESFAACDREVISLCIRKWFGSESAFERLVSTDVSSALASALGDASFSYLWLLMVSAPISWGHMDQVAARLHAQDMEAAAATAIIDLTYYFLAFPLVGRLGIILACKARRQRHQIWANELMTCAVYFAVFPVGTVLLAMQTLLMRVMNPLTAAGLFAAINLILLVTLLRQCSHMSLLSQDVQEKS